MLSRKRKTITGKSLSLPNTKIKPVKARQLIRRYHHLISKRKLILNKLKTLNDDNTNNDIKKNSLELNKLNQLFKNISKDEKLSMENNMLKIQSINNDNEKLNHLLNYINYELIVSGGIEDYQKASNSGQDPTRGGDSSGILVKWLRDLYKEEQSNEPIAKQTNQSNKNHEKRTALEIGALSVKNKISTCGMFNVTRIDLENSQEIKGIEKQDFMKRPLIQDKNELFDVISCSLVLNFVPEHSARGEMCKRFSSFLKPNGYIFIVLPLPCMENSRYMNKQHFISLMESLGYSSIHYKTAKKVCYMLFQFKSKADNQKMKLFKKKLN
ncbi:hypothetical protein TBLA_0E03410 [Henningerozyma blattae CBS 6284]|uniref:25S rRNA adenine-N(1) methyltransferase n=1 Tax=Henningerozyma blattae (strain ATCC 34711 / CBS 6284 / DSM 70876 / NBRC 10599 / NRRL Y-10934 / UCD 77-7) TaxID=1071380 RepID=I2H4U3_HENB6|nr:hypothetical protein TBLA_0E03410 [Tetrapisispora blattae CBS 6284]CCH61395.1 hypothetical protein TBLA_0E03410 [Tetrapisispora blattae CBS 6284]